MFIFVVCVRAYTSGLCLQLDPDASKEFMGYVVGANPFAQMLLSPLVGWWANRSGSIRQPLLFTTALFTTSSAAYSALEVLPIPARKHCMLISRFLVGVSSGTYVHLECRHLFLVYLLR